MMSGLEAFTAAAAKVEEEEAAVAAYDDDDNKGKKKQQPQEEEEQQGRSSSAARPTTSSGSNNNSNNNNQASSLSSNLQLHDHFTLRTPVSSCSIRHRGNLVHVYDLRTSQIQLVEHNIKHKQKSHQEEEGNEYDSKEKKTTILELRHINYDRGCGIGFIRWLYTLIGLFFVGLLFVFAFQIILFLFMDLIVDAGLTSSEDSFSEAGSPWKFIGTLFSIPIFLYGLSALLATSCFFVSEIWQGHTWLKQINDESDDSNSSPKSNSFFSFYYFSAVTMEWITLFVNLIIPLLVMIFSLFASSQYWWSYTFYTWLICMMTYFLVFCGIVLYYEIEAAWLISKCIKTRNNEEEGSSSLETVLDFIIESVMHRQNATWGGNYHKVKITAGGEDHYDVNDHVENDKEEENEEQKKNDDDDDDDPAEVDDVEEQQQQQQQQQDVQKKKEGDAPGQQQQQQQPDSSATSSKRRKNNNKYQLDTSLLTSGVLKPSERCCMRWYTKFTEHKNCTCLFESVNPPHRIYNLDDLFNKRTFMTKYSWSLERIFCSNRRSNTVAVIKGPAGVSQNQILSGAICTILSIVLCFLLIISGLVWTDASSVATILFIIVVMLCACLPRIGSIRRILKVYEKLNNNTVTTNDGEDGDDAGRAKNENNENEEEEEDGMYQTFEEYRVTQPTKLFRTGAFVLHIGLLYVFPTVILIMIRNWPLVGLFLIIEIWSAVRYWLDPCVLLQNLGSFDYVASTTNNQTTTTTTKGGGASGGGEINISNDGIEVEEDQGNDTGKFSSSRNHNNGDDDVDDVSSWRVRSRISTIMLNVTRSPGRSIWMWTLTLLMLAILSLTIGSIGYFNNQNVQGGTGVVLDDDFYDVSNITGVDGVFWGSIDLTPRGNFEYPPLENMQYPTCRLWKGFQFPDGESTGLADYAFLATIIYQTPESLPDSLDAWFGPGVAQVDFQTTRDFRAKTAGGAAAVNYQIVSFGDELSVILVRGSTTSWEWLTDAQLWSAVAFTQVVQAILPAGIIFNPILVGVLRAMSFVQSSELQEVALYQQTTDLVRYMREERGYNDIHITGQSLGGGIALITGAQTNIPAVAISGPNNMFSRQTFDPPLDLESINSMLFNVIPERDMVPMVDKPGLLTQHIACRAETGSLFGCHTSTRTLCEIIYKCGSYDRPPPCECAVKYGYPAANQVAGDQTFTDVCGPNRSNDGWYAPS